MSPSVSQLTRYEESDSEAPPLDEHFYLGLTNHRCIRLLILFPGKARSDIVCELAEYNLDWSSAYEGENAWKKIEYEALSWAWGSTPALETIRIRYKNRDFGLKVPISLLSALEALRHRRQPRYLWVDYVCIDQGSMAEKNVQVPLMSEIYGGARTVCIWLGDADSDSDIALPFIKNEVLHLQRFDKLCDDLGASPKWIALLNLMQRPWFNRRWVIQEIALAKDAVVYCGRDHIQWKSFTSAVQLIVEVENAGHRISATLKRDRNAYMPGWFEYVSSLGASLLVDATNNMYRFAEEKRLQSLLGIEYLVSRLYVFEVTEPRDTIYALLGLARDTYPIDSLRLRKMQQDDEQNLPGRSILREWVRGHTSAKQYVMDYEQPYIDVCQQFVRFCLRHSDPTRSLDIICRPWAPASKDASEVMPSWIPQLSGAAHAMYTHPNSLAKMARQNADSLVGLPDLSQRNYSAAGTTILNLESVKFKKRKAYFSMHVSGFILDTIGRVESPSQGGYIPEEWVRAGGWENLNEDPPDEFWRTLVADRSTSSRNAPAYGAQAFRESITKGKRGGYFSTTELVNEGGSSIVSEFFRRVQAVIWNRSLARTKTNRLGIVRKDVREDDLICILYGCSVPVALRRHVKSPSMLRAEAKEDVEEQERLKQNLVITLQRQWRHQMQSKASRRAHDLSRSETTTSTPIESSARPPPPPPPSTLNGHGYSLPTTLAVPVENTATSSLSSSCSSSSSSSHHYNPVLHQSPTPVPRLVDSSISNSADTPKKSHEPVSKSIIPPGTMDSSGEGSSYYEFLGECYIHGMMNGEAIVHQNHKQVRAGLFELR